MFLSHSPSTSPVQTPQSTPNIPANLSPNLVKRMQQGTCYNCGQLGHWSCYCPLKSSKTKHDSSSSEIPASISPNLEERMKQSTCYICGYQGHWSWYCPFKSSKTKHHSSTPEVQASMSPNLEERMKQSTCYSCGYQGHWSWYCPFKSSKTKHHSSTPEVQASVFPNLKEELMKRTLCDRCGQRGHGSWKCPSKSSNAKPISPSPKHDCSSNLIRCDDPIYESDFQPPAVKYPMCACGAGVCRRVKGTGSHDAFKYFFACPIKQGHGSCGYLVPEDELPKSKSIVPIQQSMPKTLNDFGDGLLVQTKTIRITNHSGDPSSMGVFEIADIEDAGSPPMGWLGRLLFFYPSPSLKFLTPQPFFCCVFPSYNAIAVPKQKSIPDDHVECNQLAISSVGQLSDPVLNYISSVSSVEEIDKSMESSLTVEKHNKLIEEEKMRFAQLQDEYVKTEALHEASNRRKQLLCEQVSILKAMLDEKQNQLKFCELETLKIEICFGDLKRRMLESDITLKERVEQTEVARKESEERQAKQIAVKTMLEKVKLEIEN